MSASLTVEIDGEGRDVTDLVAAWLNGQVLPLEKLDQGARMAWTGSLAPGGYVVGLARDRRRRVERRLTLAEGEAMTVRVTLAELEGQPDGNPFQPDANTDALIAEHRPDLVAAQAALTVSVEPPSASVLLDGEPLTGPRFRRTGLPPGDYSLEVSAPGRLSRRQVITLAPGAEASLSLVLDQAPSALGHLLGGDSPAAAARRGSALLYGVGAALGAAAALVLRRARRPAS